MCLVILVAHLAAHLGLPAVWEFEVAAMLSHIGCITAPSEIFDKVAAGEPLSEAEQEALANHPAVAQKLLENIPRMEGIARMIGFQQSSDAVTQDQPSPGPEARIALGAQMLKTPVDFDHLILSGLSREEALSEMRGRQARYNLQLLVALESVDVRTADREVRTLPLNELDTRMMIDEDVRAQNGMLLLGKGQEVTYSVIARLKNFASTIGVREPLQVRAPVSAQTALPAPRRLH